MIEPIVLEFKIDDRFIDHPLLSKKELLKYDIDYCYKKVEEEVDKFISVKLIIHLLMLQLLLAIMKWDMNVLFQRRLIR